MKDILTDRSASALVRAIKANLLEFFRYLGRAAQTDFHADDRFIRWHTRLPHPWFNGVIAMQPPAPDDGSIVEEHTGYFRSRDVPLFTWWLDPRLPISAWADLLLLHHFKLDHDTPGMAIALRTLPAETCAPDALQIVPVEDRKTLKQWAHTFILGYELPAAWEKDFLDLMAGIGLDLPVRNYLGYLCGEPAATSNLFLAAGVAGVQCVATVPKARGRGLGAALTLAPLWDALEMGYQVGILQSSEMGFKLYQRLGFQKLCEVEHFYRATETNFE